MKHDRTIPHGIVVGSCTPAAASRSSQDRRAQRSRETILAAALELLEESGVGGFSVDEVVRRCAVAKTTIYRHWPTREALVLDACTRISDEQEIPDTGTLSGDLHAHLTTIAELLRRRTGRPSCRRSSTRPNATRSSRSSTARSSAAMPRPCTRSSGEPSPEAICQRRPTPRRPRPPCSGQCSIATGSRASRSPTPSSMPSYSTQSLSCSPWS